MPFVALSTLEGKKYAGAPDAIPERKAEDDGSVEILLVIAAVDCSPMSRGYFTDPEVCMRGHQMLNVLVNAE